jgi:hypothetical protein
LLLEDVGTSLLVTIITYYLSGSKATRFDFSSGQNVVLGCAMPLGNLRNLVAINGIW